MAFPAAKQETEHAYSISNRSRLANTHCFVIVARHLNRSGQRDVSLFTRQRITKKAGRSPRFMFVSEGETNEFTSRYS